MVTTTERLVEIVAAQQDVGTASLELQDVFDVIITRAQELTRADGAALELVEGTDLVYQAASGSAVHAIGLRVPVASSLSGLAVRSGEAQRCDDATTDLRVDAAACERVGLRSMIVVPLLQDGHRDGALKVMSAEPGAFDDDDVSSLQLMAGLMTAAMARAHRFAAEEARTAALRTMNETKTAFVVAASHDLRSPLAAVAGFADLLDYRADQLDPQTIREYARYILAGTKKVQRLLANLLDVERLSAGNISARRRRTCLDDLVRAVVAVHDIDPRRTIDVDLQDVTADVDADLMERVIDNLLGNAVKYTPPEATVWVRLRSSGDRISLVVEDEGPGVPPQDRQRILQPFVRGDGLSGTPGTGVGLHLVNRFVALHGGSIAVGQRNGGGASFCVEIPVTPPA